MPRWYRRFAIIVGCICGPSMVYSLVRSGRILVPVAATYLVAFMLAAVTLIIAFSMANDAKSKQWRRSQKDSKDWRHE